MKELNFIISDVIFYFKYKDPHPFQDILNVMLDTQNSVNYFSPGRKIGLNVPYMIDNGIKNKTPKGPCGKLKIFVYAKVFGP